MHVVALSIIALVMALITICSFVLRGRANQAFERLVVNFPLTEFNRNEMIHLFWGWIAFTVVALIGSALAYTYRETIADPHHTISTVLFGLFVGVSMITTTLNYDRSPKPVKA